MNGLSGEEINEWIDIGNDEAIEEELSEEAIVQTVFFNAQGPQETGSVEDEATSTTHIKWGDASEALNKFEKCAETWKYYDVC